MPSERILSSALSVGKNERDIAILVVGGLCFSDDRTVELLLNQSSSGKWQWRTLAPLLGSKISRPGMLLLDAHRVLVVGGCNTDMAELFHLPKDDHDLGQWSYIPDKVYLSFSYLVRFDGRILAFGKEVQFEIIFAR